MRRCFVDIGLAEDREKYPDTGFNKYTSHRRGTLLHASSAFKKLEEAEDATSLGEEATGLLMLQRGGADSDDEGGAADDADADADADADTDADAEGDDEEAMAVAKKNYR